MTGTVHLGPGDAGREVRVAAGGSIVLELPENPTTGVRWNLAAVPAALVLVRDDYRASPADTGIGAGTTRILEFRGDTPGRYALHLRRQQEWEGDASTDAEFDFTLVVGDV